MKAHEDEIKSEVLADEMVPVSYTHLDVYKRQIEDCEIICLSAVENKCEKVINTKDRMNELYCL